MLRSIIVIQSTATCAIPKLLNRCSQAQITLGTCSLSEGGKFDAQLIPFLLLSCSEDCALYRAFISLGNTSFDHGLGGMSQACVLHMAELR